LRPARPYEVCLADQIHTDAGPERFALYRALRRNPAPFAAYLKPDVLALLRSADPARDEAWRSELVDDEKTPAAHVMIVDLLRNDLGSVAGRRASGRGMRAGQLSRRLHQRPSCALMGVRVRSEPDAIEARSMEGELVPGLTAAPVQIVRFSRMVAGVGNNP
jgi:hypothetical protein